MKLRAFLLMAALALSAHAQETVIVPYDPQRPPAEQHPDHLYLPYERFLNLWEAAKKARSGEPPAPPAPVASSLSAARYEARLEDRVLQVTGRFELFTGQPWAKVPFAFKDATVSALTVDGAPAALSGETLIVEKPGVHTLEVHLQVARDPGEMSLTWGVPKSVATLLVLTLPRPQMTAAVTPGSGTVERLAEGVRTVTAALGITEEIAIELSTAPAPTALAQPATATIHESVEEFAAEEIATATVDFAFPGATQNRFTVLLDPGVELIELSAANLQSWTLRPQGNRQALELTLYEPAHDSLQVHLTSRRTPAPTREGAAPAVGAVARRVEVAEVALLAESTLDVSAQPGAGLRQIAATEKAPPGLRLVAAYAGSGVLGYRAAPRPPRREARIEYLYQVQRRQVELFASMQLFAKGDPLLETTLALPPGYSVETVQCPRPHDWWRDGDRLHVRFRDATPEVTSLVVYLVHREAAEPAGLTLAPVKLEGFRKVTGDAVVAARFNVELGLQLTGEAKEMSALRAAPSFQVLPPLQRQRGFELTGQDFAGTASMHTLPARLLVTWTTRVEAHESWLALSTQCRPTLRQGGLERLRFSLPADLPEARVSGADLRETRSHVEGDRRLYDLEFQGETVGDFTIDLDLPHQGRAAVPAPEFPEAERTAGFIAIENGSEGEMTVETKGLEPAVAADLPWKPERLAGGKIFRVPPGAWSASVAVERLEKAAGRRAFCAWADLTTALRRDGTEWHRAVWHLQNRALQFLPVRLPEGAELVSARVAGQSVRADAATIEGGPAVLIPLIKTRPGELSYDVEAVYRIVRPTLEQQETHDMHDPALLGITVERTFWHLFLPSGYRLGQLDGNLDPVVGELATADKLDEAVKELHELRVIANSSDNNVETRQKAAKNFDVLWSMVQTENRSQPAVGGRFRGQIEATNNAPVGFKGKQVQEQNAYVAQKRAEVDQALQKEAEQLKDAKSELARSAENLTIGSIMRVPQGGAKGASQSQPGNVQNFGLPTPAPRPTPAPTNNLYLNDNVILNGGTVSVHSGATADNSGVNGGMLSTARGNAVANGSAVNVGGNYESGTGRSHDQNGFAGSATGPSLAGVNTYSGGTTITGGTLSGTGGLAGTGGRVPSLADEVAQEKLARKDQFRDRSEVQPLPPRPGTQLFASDQPKTALQPNIGKAGAPVAGGAANISQSENAIDALVFQPPVPAAPRIPGLEALPEAPPSMGSSVRGDNRAYASSQDMGPVAGAAQDATRGGAPTPAPNAPRADRRTTLAVDFPTEGAPLHFKKLKGAAQLKVTLVPTKTTHRLRNLALFGLGALVLGVVQRRRSPRKDVREGVGG